MPEKLPEFKTPQPVTVEHKTMPSKLTVVQTVYYQPQGRKAVSTSTRHSRLLGGSEDPYSRHLSLGKNWEKVDLGWVKTPGICVLTNRTKGEILEIGVCTGGMEKIESGAFIQGWTLPLFLVHPDDSFRYTPAPGVELYIRFRDGVGEVSVTAVADNKE